MKLLGIYYECNWVDYVFKGGYLHIKCTICNIKDKIKMNGMKLDDIEVKVKPFFIEHKGCKNETKEAKERGTRK